MPGDCACELYSRFSTCCGSLARRLIAEFLMRLFLYVLALALVPASLMTAQKTGPTTDTSVIDANGTAHITRVVPVPQTLSPETQKLVGRQVSDAAHPQTLAERRSGTDAWQTQAGAEAKALYPVNVSESTIAGVPVRIVMPLRMDVSKLGEVLINVHGGGFNSDSGSLTESIPIANLTQMKVGFLFCTVLRRSIRFRRPWKIRSRSIRIC